MSEEVNLPPTKTRLNLAAGIKAGQVRWYAWKNPQAFWMDGLRERAITSEVKLLIQRGIASIPDVPANDYGPVTLTPAGEAWLAAGQERAS